MKRIEISYYKKDGAAGSEIIEAKGIFRMQIADSETGDMVDIQDFDSWLHNVAREAKQELIFMHRITERDVGKKP